MDQVKNILGQIKKYHFWVLCGVIAFVGLGSWYMTQASLQEEREANLKEIESGYSTTNQLNSAVNPPNTIVHEAMELRIRELQDHVKEVWQNQYNHQKDTILIWPSELTAKFRRAVEPLRPIEAKVEFPTPDSQEIPRDLRSEYANYVENELPKLAKIIGARWTAVTADDGTGFGGGQYGSSARYGQASGTQYGPSARGPYGEGGPNAGVPEEAPVVEWSQADQAQLMAKFTWTKQPGGVPTTLQVLYAQEDLWVLKNLMEIINKTNDGATERHKAYLKAIHSIQLGRDAAGRNGLITPVMAASDQTGAYPGASGIPGAEGGYPGQGAMTGSTQPGMPSPEGGPSMYGPEGSIPGQTPYGSNAPGAAVAIDPASFRYVDKTYKPLSAEKLRADVTQNPDDVYLAVAKRMPVRLVCQMDQRKIHKLLTECGNSPLTVEVRQVRIGGDAGKATAGGYGASSPYGSGFGGGSFRGSSRSSFSGFGVGAEGGASSYRSGYGSSGANAALLALQSSNDVVVEVYGIVYIYNPVNEQALGIDKAGQPSAGDADALTADAGTQGSPS